MTPQLARKLDPPARKRSASDPLVPLGRTWALHTEVQQVLDAVVIVAAMLLAYELRVAIGASSTRLNPVLPSRITSGCSPCSCPPARTP